MSRLSLGLDSSTQSLSAVVINIDTGEIVYQRALDYIKDSRLNGFGIRKKDYIIPPRVEGEADQPPEMFFASLDAMFSDMKKDGLNLEDVVVINNSAQQHGHVYLNARSQEIFSRLHEPESSDSDLVTILDGCLAYKTAPIWMTSNTLAEANLARNIMRGKEAMIMASGSNAPLRFTGAVIRRVAEQFPKVYHEATTKIQLISSLIAGILSGNPDVPIDFGNGSGMSLMDYRRKQWSDALINAHTAGMQFPTDLVEGIPDLPGGAQALRAKLPDLVAPDKIVGTIAAYFVQKYGFNPDCKVVAGSGDNPQSKVLVAGDLLSLGTSFVNMVSTDGNTFDMNGLANAMYDGIGRPFMFGCRTNGANVWDQLRALHGMEKGDYARAEEALRKAPLGRYITFWSPKSESFPVYGTVGLTSPTHQTGEFEKDYPGLVEATLASVCLHSMYFSKICCDEPLYVMGGATDSPEIMRRVAAIWNRPVIPVAKGGAALGAAVAGAYAFLRAYGDDPNIELMSSRILARSTPIKPDAKNSGIYHGNGYLKRLGAEEAKLIETHHVK